MAGKQTLTQRIALDGGKEIQAELEALGKSGKRVWTELQVAAASFKGPDSSAVARLKEIQAQLDSMGKSFASAGKALKDVGSGLSTYVTVPLAAAGTGIIKVAGDFEEAMNDLKVNTQATGEEFSKLRDLAREIGKDTAFGPQEAAAAMSELAKVGVSTRDILSGTAKAVVEFATANKAELAPAATAAADLMKQFNISVKDLPAALKDVSGTINKSKLDFAGYQAAIGQVGGVAGLLGVSLHDLNDVLGSTASSFGSGQDAATSFKTFILALPGLTDKAGGAIEKYGLKFFDSAGKLKSFGEIADQLKSKLGNLNGKELQETLKDIFGNDAFRTGLALMKGGSAALREFRTEVEKFDQAKAAEARMAGLKGSIKQLTGSLEDLAITIGDTGILEWATNLVKGLERLVDTLNKTNPELLKTIAIIGGIVGVVGPVLFALGVMATGFGAVLKGAGELSGVFAKVALSVDNFLGKFGKFGGLVKQVLGPWGRIAIGLAVYWKDILDGLEQFYNALFGDPSKVTSKWLAAWALVLVDLFNAVKNLLNGNGAGAFDSLKKAGSDAWMAIKETASAAIGNIIEAVTLIWLAWRVGIKGVGAFWTATFGAAFTAIRAEANATAAQLEKRWASLAVTTAAATASAGSAAVGAGKGAAAVAPGVGGAAGAAAAGEKAAVKMEGAFARGFKTIGKGFLALAGGPVGIFLTSLLVIAENWDDIQKGFDEGVNLDRSTKEVDGFWQNVGKGGRLAGDEIAKIFNNEGGIVAGVTDAFAKINQQYSQGNADLVAQVDKGNAALVKKWKELGTESAAAFKEGIAGLFTVNEDTVKQIEQNLTSEGQAVSGGWTGLGRDSVAGFTAFMKSLVTVNEDTIKKVESNLNKANGTAGFVKNAKGELNKLPPEAAIVGEKTREELLRRLSQRISYPWAEDARAELDNLVKTAREKGELFKNELAKFGGNANTSKVKIPNSALNDAEKTMRGLLGVGKEIDQQFKTITKDGEEFKVPLTEAEKAARKLAAAAGDVAKEYKTISVDGKEMKVLVDTSEAQKKAQDLKAALSDIGAKVAENLTGKANEAKAAFEAVKEKVLGIKDALNKPTGNLAQDQATGANPFNELKAKAEQAQADLPPIIEDIKRTIASVNTPTNLEQAQATGANPFDELKAKAEQLKAELPPIISEIDKIVAGVLLSTSAAAPDVAAPNLDQAQATGANPFDELKAKAEALQTDLPPIVQAGLETIPPLMDQLNTDLSGKAEQTATDVGQKLSVIGTGVTFDQFTASADTAFADVNAGADQLGQDIPASLRVGIDTTKSLWDTLTSGIKGSVDGILASIQSVIDKLSDMARAAAQNLDSADPSSSGTGANFGSGFATGGHVRGPGSATSDSILAWLSDGEYVHKTASVRFWGKPLMDAINRMDLGAVRKLLSRQGFAKGGLVSQPSIKLGLPAFSAGGLSTAMAGALGTLGNPIRHLPSPQLGGDPSGMVPVNIHIPGHNPVPMMAQPPAIQQLARAAGHKKLTTGGTKPSWYK